MGVDARLDDAKERQLGYLRSLLVVVGGTYRRTTYDMTTRTHELHSLWSIEQLVEAYGVCV
jgi:hypothetical protein